MKMLKRWISVCLVILLLAGVAFDHSSLIGSTVEAAGLEETDGASTEETSDAPSLLSEGDESDTPAPEEQTVTNTDTETEEPVEKTETKQEESTEPEKQTVTNSDTETKAPAKKTETKQEESAEPEKQTVTNSDTETKAPVESQTSTAAPATPEKKQEAMKLDQEIKDGNGTVVFKVTADIKEDTFDANTDEVTMKVSAVDKDLEDSIKKLMEKNLAADKELGSYFLYKVEFQVNGKTVEPGKEVKITFEPKDYKIDDVKDATVFYYNEANSPAGNKEAEIKEIIQKQEKIEALQKAGQSIENIDKDYDLTEITLKADKTTEKIVTEGRRSTVYGCYLEDELDSLTYENDEVTITVSETEIGAIPDEAALKVVPILEDDKDTEDQYKEVEEQLQKKAAEDEKDVAGFLAYDITFVDKDGNEIEPNSEVKVTMEYKEPALPAEKNTKDVKDTEVSVLHFEEDKDGNVKEVVDMNEAGQLDALETGDEQQVEKVEVRTDSFSIFLITWNNYGNNKFGLTVEAHYVYVDGNNVFEIDPELAPQANISIDRANQLINLSTYKKTISGYTYSKTVKDDALSNYNVAYLKSSETRNAKKIQTSENDSRYSDWLTTGNKEYGRIYFVYEKIETDVKIEDQIIEDGSLTAVYSGAGDKSEYQWKRCDTFDGTYEEVESKAFNNNGEVITSISENGRKLYPALDEGARMWYKVEITLGNGTKIESSPLRVRYYDRLENGGFENPVVPEGSNLQYGNGEYESLGGVWQSTGEIYNSWYPKYTALEIITETGDGASAYSWKNDNDWNISEDLTAESGAAPEGKQFAELNAQAAGALYQDVLTVEGTQLNYWLQHRARGGNKENTAGAEYDTMYLVIMPTKIAQQEDLTTQDNLEDYLRNNLRLNIDQNPHEVGNEIIYPEDEDGILVVRVTSNDEAWQFVRGTAYVPKAAATRFFFVAGETAKSVTEGNFLDNVGFGQELPPVADDEFSLQIEKEIKGLDNTGIETLKNNIQFKIEATKNGYSLKGEEVAGLLGLNSNIISGKEMTSSLTGLSLTIANKKIIQGETYKFTVTELNADLGGYKHSTASSAEITIGDGNPSTVQGMDSITVDIKGKTTATVTFTNTYERSENKKINFTKYWDDANNKYSTRPESLTVTLKPTVTIDGTETDISKYLAEGGVVLQKTLSGGTTASSWSTYWEVPVYYNHEGVKYKIDYSVEEGEVNSEYVYESSGLQTGTEYTPTFVDDVTKTDEAEAQSSVSKANRLKAASASATNASANARAGEDDLGAPEHNKYIEFNPSTGEYTLNLDVTGKKGDTTGADILFVIDKSGSMGKYPGWPNDPEDFYELLPDVKELLANDDGIIDQIFAAEDNVNSVAYVAFSDEDGTDSSQWYTKDNYEGSGSGYWHIDGIKDKIKGLSANGGTNWTLAMEEASDLLAQRSASSNEKIVIFLSDGTPTYTMKYDRYGRYYEDGNGNDTKNSYYDDAARVVNSSDSLRNAQFYSVYLVDAVQDGMSTFNNKLNNPSHSLVDGTDLQKSLQEILNKIIPTYKNVEITDVLSEYVEFEDEKPTITVTKTESGKTVTLDSNQYKATVSGSTVNVELLNGGSLEDGVTYTVSFRVVPSEKANTEYVSSGYPHIGEDGTGSTSAGKKGFYSNDNEQTKLSYSIDGVDNSDDNVPYQKPVVQVTTHTLTYHKIWNHPSSVDEPTEGVTLTVTYSDGTKKDIKLSSPKYTYTETVPISKTVTSVEEKNGNPDYTPSYSITDGGTNITVTNNYSKSTASSITVNKVWEDKGHESNRPKSITVGLFRSENGGEAEQYRTAVLNSANNWTETWDNLPQTEGSGTNMTTYTYAVREISTPTHYTSSIDYEYGEGEITAIITNTYDENCEDENYYIANVLQKDSITLIKRWDDNNDSQRLRSNELFITVKDGSNNKVFKLDSSNGSGNVWTRTVTVLEKKNANYAASEKLNNQYYSQTAANSGQSAGGWWFSFTNQIQSKTITVQKVWNDNNLQDRPTNISLMLQRRANSSNPWEDYRSITITSENADWTRTISGLPINYDYQIVEENVAGGYTSQVKQNGDNFTVTNTLKWSLKKTDMDSGDPIVLKGAVFDLKKNNIVIATGTSGEDGIVNWTAAGGVTFNQNNLDGTYTLVETKAPDGYQILTGATWTLTFTNGVLTDASGTEGYSNYISWTSDKDNGAVVTLKNDKLYELPSTGGSGIYWYTIGGMLLMMAGSLILYKNKRREVLERK